MSWTGKVVEAQIDRDLLLAVCVEEKKRRVRLFTVEGREETVHMRRVMHQGPGGMDVDSPRDQMKEKLEDRDRRRKALAGEIDLSTIWEFLVEEESQGFSPRYLAELFFPGDLDDDQEAAMVRRLFSDSIYFKRQKEDFFPNSKEQVKKQREKERIERQKRRRRKEVGKWIQAIWREEEPPEIEKDIKEGVIDLLKKVALKKAQNPERKEFQGYMKEADIQSSQSAFELLVKLGEYSRNENLTLLQLEIPTEFNSTEQEAAQNLVQSFSSQLENYRQERQTFSHLRILAIDDEFTRDRDDAISLEKSPEGYRLGIHIADVAELIEGESPLDQVARERGTSIYMPEETIDMLPQDVARSVFSLDEGEERLALSLFIDLSKEGEIVNYDLTESVIEITENYSYEEAEELIEEGDPFFTDLYELSQTLYEKREKEGAYNVFFPFFEFDFDDEEKVSLTKVISLARSQKTISEFMILANNILGAYLHQYGIPALFRVQPAPKSLVPLERVDYMTLFKVRRMLNRSTVETEPGLHFTLGLKTYIQVTSPIRRYGDIVNQRQIKGTLNSEGTLSEKEIKERIQEVEQALNQARKVSRDRREFWLLRYLENFEGQKIPALILKPYSSRKFLIQIFDETPPLEDALPRPQVYETIMRYRGRDNLQAGDWVYIRLGRVDVHQREVEVSFVEILKKPSGSHQ